MTSLRTASGFHQLVAAAALVIIAATFVALSMEGEDHKVKGQKGEAYTITLFGDSGQFVGLKSSWD
jgi:hypothetical protein